MLSNSPRWRAALITGVALAAIVPGLFLDPIAQSPAYHEFADRRAWLGIANFADVSSNAFFLPAGAYGIAVLAGAERRRQREARDRPAESAAYLVLFCGVLLTCFGSAYYHLAPTTERLVWDRLPMAVGFMGLLSATLAERVGQRFGQVLLVPLVLVGLLSVVLWAWTESIGQGDLRFYYAVQFVSLVLIVVMVICFPSAYTRSGDILLSIGLYAVAKVLEAQDAFVLGVIGVSGHTLKHTVAAVSVLVVARMLARRHPRSLASHVAAVRVTT